MSINRVVISGNLTRDPELRSTASGMSVLSLGVAVNDRKKNNQTGEWEDVANFIDCTMFGDRAAKIQQYLSKGSKVTIEGKLHYSSWEKDGQKRSKIEVLVDDIEFMSRNNDQQQGNQYQAPQTYGNGQQGYQQPQQYGGQPQQYGNAPQQGYQPPQQGYNAPQNNQYGQQGYQQQPVQQQMNYSAPPMPDPTTSVYDEDIPF